MIALFCFWSWIIFSEKKQNLRKENSPRRTLEIESQWRDFQRREENFQRQIREMQQREQDLFTKETQSG